MLAKHTYAHARERAIAVPLLAVAAFIIFIIVCLLINPRSSIAATGTNPQLNFQGRLLDSTGAVIADGDYNMEFTIVQDGDGCNPTSGTYPCSGTVKWTETRKQTDRVTIRNGYFSVNLGSVTAFGSNVDWNQDTLWLGINVGGTANTPTPTWDGVMKPLKRLTSSPYAFNSAALQGLTSSNFVQLAQGLQTDSSSTNPSIFINKTGSTANILELQKSGADVFTISNAGALTIANNSASGLVVSDSSSSKSVLTVDTSGDKLILGQAGASGLDGLLQFNNSAGANNVSLKLAANPGSSYTLLLPTTGPSVSQCLQTDPSTATQLVFDSCGSGGSGDNISVNGSAATNANFIDTTATGTVSGVTWTLDTGPSPDTLQISIGNASGTVAGAVTTGTQAFGGDKTFNGGLTFGDATSDTITFAGRVNSDILPITDDTYNLGDNTHRWANLFLGGETLHLGASTSDEVAISYNNTTDSFLIKNATNSITAFQVQDSNGLSLINGDTSGLNLSFLGGNAGATSAWTNQSSNKLPQTNVDADAVTANGYVYVIGGYDFGLDDWSNKVFYAKLNADGSTGAWTDQSTNRLPEGRDDATTLVANGYVYVLGGRGGSPTAVKNTVFYAKLNADGSTGAWQTNSNTLPAVRFLATSVVSNGYIYVIGGGAGAGPVFDTIFYAKLNADGSTGPWTSQGSNLLPRTIAYATSVVANGFVYVFGGTDSSSVSYDSVMYARLNADGSTGAWTDQSSNKLPATTNQATSVVANGYVYVLGGYQGVCCSTTARDTIYYSKLNSDGSTGAWTNQSTNKIAARSIASSVVANGYIYVLGGYDASGDEQDTVQYASTSRTQVYGSLDLVGLQGQTLADGGGLNFGSTGGSITAGNITAVGDLQVQGQGTFVQGLSTNGNVAVNGSQQITFGATNTSGDALHITPSFTTNATATYNGIELDAFTATRSAGTATVNGLKIGALTESGTVTSTALNIGSGWDSGLTSLSSGLFKTTNTSAFGVQDSNGLSLLGADTSNFNLSLLGGNSGAVQNWNSTTSINVGGSKPSANPTSVVANGYIYVIGGYNGGSLDTVYYAKLNTDGTVGAWSSTTSINVGGSQLRRGHSSVAANGYLYVIGGTADGSTAQDTVYYARLNTDGTIGTWNSTTSINVGGSKPRMYHTSVVSNGYLYVIGGENSSFTAQDTVYYAKLNTDGTIGTWNSTTAINVSGSQPRVFHSSVVANGYLYVIGGNSGGANVKSTVYYAKLNGDGTIGSWSSTTAINGGTAREDQSSVVSNGYLYVIGGSSSGVGGVDNVYDSKLNSDGTIGSWSSTTSINVSGSQPRWNHASVVSNGYIYVVAGTDSGTNVQDTIYYTSTSRTQLYGSLDLVGLQTGNATGTSEEIGQGSVGGTITAGNITAVGGLQVLGKSNFSQNLAIDNGGLSITNGSEYINNSVTNDSGDALHITPSFTTNATATYNGIELDAFTATRSAGTATVNGLKIGALTESGTVTSTALNIGSGWDVGLSVGTSTTGASITATTDITSGDTNGDLTITPNGSGKTIVKASTNTTGTFQVQKSDATSLLTADTSNMRIGVNNSYTNMSAPSGLTLGVSSGGSLTASTTYYYKITAIDSLGGETTASTEQSQATDTTNKKITLYWTAVTGASGYKIYRSTTTNSEVFLVGVVSSYSSGSPYTDDGTITTGSASPPSSNTAYTSSNLADSLGQISVGGYGSPTGQVYVSGVQPKLVATATEGLSGASSVYVSGRYAYVTSTTNNSLVIFDVSNPAAPKKLGSASFTNANNVYIQGRYAYVIDTVSKLQVYDVSNPSTPTRVDTNGSGVRCIGSGAGISADRQLFVQGNYAYVSTPGGELCTFDVSNPVTPRIIGAVASQGQNYQMHVVGRYAYTADQSNAAVDIYDLSNGNPAYVGSASAASTPIFTVFVQGRYAYTGGSTKFAVFDVSNPASPTTVASVSSSINIENMIVQGRYAYAVDYVNSKVAVFDISNPANPYLVSSTTSGLNGPESIFVQGRYAYVANYNGNSISVYDMGGTYTQQLEAGGAEVGLLQVNGNGQVAGDFSVQGGLNVGYNLQTSGNLAVAGGTTVKGSTILSGGNNLLGTPGAPTVACVGPCSGNATWSYKITAINASGGETAASAVGSVGPGASTVNTSLNPAFYNHITWSTVSGATAYRVYRTAHASSPSTDGFIASTTATSFDDTGYSADGTSVPTIDTTGQLTVKGSALFINSTDSTTAFQIQSSSGTSLMTVDTTTNGNLTLTAGGSGNVVISGDSNTGLVISGATTSLSTGTNGDLTIVPNGSGVTKFNEDANTNVQILTTAAPGLDMLVVDNNSNASTTSGVDGAYIRFSASNTSGDGLHITPVFTTNATATYNGIELDAFTATQSAGTATVNGVNIGALTESGTVTSTGIKVGSGWDSGLTVLSPVLVKVDSALAFDIQDSGGHDSLVFDSNSNTLKVYEDATSPSNYASISATASDATFKSNTGTTKIGSGTGTITISAGSGSGITITGNAASNYTTTAGGLTFTAAAASTWSTTAGDLTLQAGSGTVSLGTSTTLTASAGLTISTASNGDLTLAPNGTGNVVVSGDSNTGLVISGATTSITTGTNGALTITPNGSGDTVFNTDADTNVQITATAAPGVDMVSISNSGQGVATAGVSGLQITYVGGAAAVEASGERIDITGGTTGGAGAIWNGLRVTQGTITADTTVRDIKLETAALTSTSGTTVIEGLNIASAGAINNATAGSINWNGLAVTTPNVTQGASGTATADALDISIGTLTTAGKQNGINFSSIAAPTVGSTAGLYFSDIDWADLHSTTAANNNLANIVIKQSATGSNANTFTIKNDASTMLPLFELRDITSGSGGATGVFGGLALAGGFVSQQTYFGEEFNFAKGTVGTGCSDSTVSAVTNTVNRRGDGYAGAVTTAPVTCAAGIGELSTSSDGNGTSSGTCVYSNPTPSSTNTGGIERIAATGAATPRTSMCLETNGNTTGGSQYSIFNSGNLPQIVMKVRPSQVGSSSFPVYVGISDRAAADAATGGMLNTNKGYYFTNCSQPVTPTCTAAGWTGVVADGTTNPPNTVNCPATAISTTKFSYLRIEVRKVSAASTAQEVQFFVDYDPSDGISEISCGTITATTNNMGANVGMGTLLAASSIGSATAQNLDVDYFRVWQDDSPTAGSSGESTTNPDSTSFDSTPSENASPLTLDSGTATDQIGMINFLAATSEDTVFNHDVYVRGTLHADKIQANQIEGLDVLADKIGSLSDKLVQDNNAQTSTLGSSTTSPPQSNGTNIDMSNLSIRSATIALDLNVMGALVANGSLTVHGDASFLGNVSFGGHLSTNGDAPQIKYSTADGLSGSAQSSSKADGNDISGELSIDLGETPARGKLITLNFKKTYSKPPKVLLTPENEGAAAVQYFVKSDVNGFTITITGGQLNPNDNLLFNYLIVQ